MTLQCAGVVVQAPDGLSNWTHPARVGCAEREGARRALAPQAAGLACMGITLRGPCTLYRNVHGSTLLQAAPAGVAAVQRQPGASAHAEGGGMEPLEAPLLQPGQSLSTVDVLYCKFFPTTTSAASCNALINLRSPFPTPATS